MPTVHLVDASVYIFRAYFAVPDSLPNNAARGFLDFLSRLVREEEVTHLGVAFDESLTTSFRNDVFPGYKASRGLAPPELEAQLGACGELAEAFGAATFVHERYEADDLIAALCARLDAPAVIVTSDKDLAQLVSDRVTLLDFAKGDRYTPAEVEAKFGVPPAHIADYLGLVGDKVDDIPGVKGVGKKSAAALLQAFPGLDALYARLDEVPDLPLRGAKSLAAKLAAGRESAFLSRRLATVAADAPAAATLDDLRYDGADATRLDPLLERLELGGLRGRVPLWVE